MTFNNWLRTKFRYKNIGWKEIGEEFTRFQLVKTRWFNIYLHRLSAPSWHPECHDHPWSFVAVLLKSGYLERTVKGDKRKYPGMILWRPATFAHNVITPYGVSWSLIITGPVARKWGFLPCNRLLTPLSYDKYRKIYGSK